MTAACPLAWKIALSLLLWLVPTQADPGAYWLERFGLASWAWDVDHDLDGLTARDEYRLGTDPTIWNIPTPLDFAGGDLGTLSWDANEGALYQPEFSDGLSSFDPLGDPILGDGQATELVTNLDLSGEDRFFFRLMVLEPLDGDGDGLSSIEEAIVGTLANDDDTDGDNRSDGDELRLYRSDPLVFDPAGATIEGTVFQDPNGDGDLADGQPVAEARVYLDANYNGLFDSGEVNVLTDASGDYQFLHVSPGWHHVRQVLMPPQQQSHPQGGGVPTFDLLPDEVVNYTHAAPGEGNLDVAYGDDAPEDVGLWAVIEDDPVAVEPVSPDLVLKPIGVRNVVPPLLTYFGSEFLSLPLGAEITVRFDEAIIDGPGPDLLLHPPVPGTGAVPAEQVEVFLGSSEAVLTSIGTHFQADGVMEIDLANHDVPAPIHFIKVRSLNSLGSWRGFELVGFEALNVAYPDPDAHVVQVTAQEVFQDLDFGRFAVDREPTVIVGLTDLEPSTTGTLVGESARVDVRVLDDLGVVSVNLEINGIGVALNSDQQATFTPTHPGITHLQVIATDSGGNAVTETVLAYVRDAEGNLPFDDQTTGLSETSGPGAPEVRIVSPAPGTVSSQDVTILADIVSSPAVAAWEVAYAPVDDIDPYNLAANDPDYVLLASGNGNVYSAPVGVLPLSTLADGIYFVRIKADEGFSGNSRFFGQVIAKNVSEADLRPQVTIASPSPESQVAVLAELTGTITSTRPLREWYVELAPTSSVDPNNLGAPGPDWSRLASGTDPVNDVSSLAVLDATALRSDAYTARIVAWNDIGLGWAEPLAFNVTGDVKLGRNRLRFTDVFVDLDGFPLQFSRVYDSYQAEEDGELGFGWALELQDADIAETVPDTSSNPLFGSTPFRDGTRVYITAPTGERLGFTFQPEFAAGSLFGAVYRVTFVPDPGVYHRLEVPEGDEAFLTLASDGAVYVFFIGLPYNPDTYVLTDPMGTRYTYHEDDGFLGAENANGHGVTMGADGVTHTSGEGIAFERDAAGRIEAIVSPGGDRWTFAYNAMGELETVTDPENRVVTYHYLSNPAHYLERIEDPLGRQPIRYEYDAEGRLVATIDADGNRQESGWDPGSFSGTVTTARGFTTQLVYDERGNVTQETDPLGNVTRFTYDDPANPDRETSMTTPDGDVWTYTYDAQGNRTSIDPPGFFLPVYEATYNGMGQVTSQRDTTGATATFTFDDRGNLLSQRGDVVPHFDATYSPEGRRLTTKESDDFSLFYRYDARGRLAGVSNTHLYEGDLTFDAQGNLTGFSDVDGNTATFTYDARGIVASEVGANGSQRTFVDNGDGTHTMTDPNGVVSTVSLDAMGRAKEVTMPGNAKITATHDADGNLDSLTDPLGNVMQFTYDAENRLLSGTRGVGLAETYEYDSLGQGAAIVTSSGKRRSFTYDTLQRLTSEKWHAGDGSVIKTFTFAYLGRDRRFTEVTETTDAGLHRHGFSGFPNFMNSTVTEYAGQAGFRLGYTWEQAGDREPVPRDVLLSAGITPVARIRAQYLGGRAYNLSWIFFGAQPTQGLRFVRNRDGSVKTLERTSGASGTLHSKTHFTYVSTGPVASIRHEDANGALAHPNAEMIYQRDVGNRVTSITHAGNQLTVGYDAMSRVASVAHTNPAYADEAYSFDGGGNRLTSHLTTGQATVGTGNLLTATSDFTYTHDADGNVATRVDRASGEVTAFTYDHRNRLVTATVHLSAGAAASTTIHFAYDFANRLISREINGVKTWILYDRQMPIAEFADGATDVSKLFFYSLDEMDAFHASYQPGTGVDWYLKDHLGSVRGVMDDGGNVDSWRDYDAFGNLIGGSAGTESLGYASRFRVDELGLYENRRRFYEPAVGRFTQPDPLHVGGGDLNLYAYVGNNPMIATDPMGTVSAIEYNILDAIGGIDSVCSAAGIADQIDQCFRDIAAILNSPSGGGGSGSCVSLPMPGPLPYPAPNFQRMAELASGALGGASSLAESAGAGGGGSGGGGGGGGSGGGGSAACPSL